MGEDAQGIFEYLPIRRDAPENDYINHLWQAFSTLDEGEAIARPFAVMPFHLLFMMAVQYKILRISKAKRTEYEMVFTINSGREREVVLNPESVFDIALLNERSIPDLLKLIGLDAALIKQIKNLIDNRNDNLAHAKGGIEPELEKRIEEYLVSLRAIQTGMQALNDGIASEWSKDLTTEDDGKEFVESRLLDSYLCPADFKVGVLESKFGKFVV